MKYYIIIISLFAYNISQADITLDGTLGSKVALEGPDYNIGADLGQQYGNNLFHSFEKFNINTDEIATFSGPANISNVISRVTGGNFSNIDGTIRSTIPNADMYLINPAGIVFGKNAVLDVQGSFHASTANTLRFQDGGKFNSTNPQSSILTVAPVTDFGFLTNSASLNIEGARLNVPETKTLSLIGQNIQINSSVLKAESGRINIASVAQGNVTLDDLTLSGTAGALSIQSSSITVKNGGDIFIRAGKFLLDNTAIQTNTFGKIAAGKIDVQVDNLIATKGSRFISNTVGAGQGGTINIKVKNEAEFSGEKVAKNSSGKVIINQSGISISATNVGNGGATNLETGSLIIKDGAIITATTYGQGQGGNINISATEAIILSGTGVRKNGSSIVANTRGKTSQAGQGGNITITTKRLELNDGALIGTNSFGSSQGGTTSIKTKNNIIIAGEDKRGVTSRISTVAANSGDGGTLSLAANELHLVDGAVIMAATAGTGNGGNIELKIVNLVKLEGIAKNGRASFITAGTQGKINNAGDGSTIYVTAKQLQLTDGSQIIATSSSSGKGGQIKLNISDKVLLIGKNPLSNQFKTAILASTTSTETNAGDAGNIEMKVGSLHLDDEAEINAETWGPGLGGNIKIQANSLELTNNGTITALSKTTGNAGQIELDLTDRLVIKNSTIETRAENADGGDLTLKTPSYIYIVNSQITTSVSEEFGGGGNINASPKFIILDGATIFAKAKQGEGGNINVTTTGIYNFTGEPIAEIINASSEFGTDGIITIKTPDNNSDEGLFTLPATLFDASKFINTPCGQKVAANISSFILIPSEGTANEIGDVLPSGILLAKLQKPASTTKNRQNFPVLALVNKCSVTEMQDL